MILETYCRSPEGKRRCLELAVQQGIDLPDTPAAELECHADTSLALHGTPLAGATLLHLCVDGDAIEIAGWLLERGAQANARAAVDAEGFGGHTPLFGCVVSQPYRVGRRRDGAFASLLLDHGADPNARASLRKRLRFVADESMRSTTTSPPWAGAGASTTRTG